MKWSLDPKELTRQLNELRWESDYLKNKPHLPGPPCGKCARPLARVQDDQTGVFKAWMCNHCEYPSERRKRLPKNPQPMPEKPRLVDRFLDNKWPWWVLPIVAVLFVAGFGFVSWAISAVYWGGLMGLFWLQGVTKIPWFLWLIAPVAWASVRNSINRR
jgi:hypothetical protein